MADAVSKSTVELTGDIVAAYLQNHAVGATQLPKLIKAVHKTLDSLSPTSTAAGSAPGTAETGNQPAGDPTGAAKASGPVKSRKQRGRDPADPAVPVADSVTPDYLVCLEDGKQLKMLKRYLNSNFGMTPTQYRKKWGLPSDYPMVAENYSKRRSEAAKRFGLGRKNARQPAS